VVLDRLARGLLERGHEVRVLAYELPGEEPEVPPPYALLRYRKPFSKKLGLRLKVRDLLRLHARWPFDLLHCHSAYPQAYIGAAFKRLRPMPMTVRPHGSDLVPELSGVRTNPYLERRLFHGLRAADTLIAQGDYMAGVMRAAGLPASRIQVINNGIDLESTGDTRPMDWPRPYLFTMGRLIQRKGFDVLLRAFARLESAGVDLVIAGGGKQELELRALVARLGLGARVHFVGVVRGAAKRRWLAGARIFVLPSRHEPFSNALLEAMAAGRPIVASDIDGNREICRWPGARLYPPGSDEVLARQLAWLLANPEEAARLGRAARDWACAFDWEAIIDRYENLYATLLAGSAGS
jgi:glycosyltransferase involved in cell wall biosynthesis